jgi:hypothetical protein
MVDEWDKNATIRYTANPEDRVFTAYHHYSYTSQKVNYCIDSGHGSEITVPTGHHVVKANTAKEAEHKLHDIEDELFFK